MAPAVFNSINMSESHRPKETIRPEATQLNFVLKPKTISLKPPDDVSLDESSQIIIILITLTEP